MSNEPLVSIIINCFNGEKYLRKCVESIISQTYKNWEIIFWDNKSSDRSAQIFKSYKDIRLKYYLADNHSSILYQARNYALDKASGEFIAFLDTDDWWLPTKLNKQIILFNDPKVGLVYGNIWRYFEKNNKKIILKKNNLPQGLILGNLLKNYLIRLSSMVIRKSYLNKLDYKFNNNFHIIGDFDLNVRIAAIYKVACVQQPVAFLRYHDKNESLINKEKEIQELKIWRDEMTKNEIISSNSQFRQISIKISYLEAIKAILERQFKKSLIIVIQHPFSFSKIKLIFALILPNYFLKKMVNY